MYRSAGYIEHIPEIFICAGWKKGGFDSCEVSALFEGCIGSKIHANIPTGRLRRANGHPETGQAVASRGGDLLGDRVRRAESAGRLHSNLRIPRMDPPDFAVLNKFDYPAIISYLLIYLFIYLYIIICSGRTKIHITVSYVCTAMFKLGEQCTVFIVLLSEDLYRSDENSDVQINRRTLRCFNEPGFLSRSKCSTTLNYLFNTLFIFISLIVIIMENRFRNIGMDSTKQILYTLSSYIER